MLELGTSGSVGGEGGNLLVYPAWIDWRPERSYWRPREMNRHCGRPVPQRPGWEGTPPLLEHRPRTVDTKDRRITRAAEANKISDRRCASGKS